MKTLSEWNESKKDLLDYLTPNDAIDDDLFDYIIGVVPPVTLSDGFVQMGEPFKTDANGNELYLTVEMYDVWTYTGIKPQSTIKQWFFTFGLGQQNFPGYVEIHAYNFHHARWKMVQEYGTKWAFQYNSLDKLPELDTIHRGTIY